VGGRIGWSHGRLAAGGGSIVERNLPIFHDKPHDSCATIMESIEKHRQSQQRCGSHEVQPWIHAASHFP
jgi:hypothetical protein